jgi:phage shock protein PspC (stress-responsive transcriptional regulator)
MNTTTASPEADTKSAINPEADTKSAISPETDIQDRPQALCRPFQDRMLAGVAIGIARYLGVDVTVVRIVLAVLTVVGGVGIPIYLAGWLLIPEEGSELSIASEFIQSLQARSR